MDFPPMHRFSEAYAERVGKSAREEALDHPNTKAVDDSAKHLTEKHVEILQAVGSDPATAVDTFQLGEQTFESDGLTAPELIDERERDLTPESAETLLHRVSTASETLNISLPERGEVSHLGANSIPASGSILSLDQVNQSHDSPLFEGENFNAPSIMRPMSGEEAASGYSKTGLTPSSAATPFVPDIQGTAGEAPIFTQSHPMRANEDDVEATETEAPALVATPQESAPSGDISDVRQTAIPTVPLQALFDQPTAGESTSSESDHSEIFVRDRPQMPRSPYALGLIDETPRLETIVNVTQTRNEAVTADMQSVLPELREEISASPVSGVIPPQNSGDPLNGAVMFGAAATTARADPQSIALTSPAIHTTSPNWPSEMVRDISLRQLSDGDELEMTLLPENLGTVTIRMNVTDRVATIHIVTDSPEAARLFNDNSHRLADQLARSGIEMGSHTSDTGRNQSEGNGGSKHQTRVDPTESNPVDGTEGAVSVMSPVPITSVRAGVDLIA